MDKERAGDMTVDGDIARESVGRRAARIVSLAAYYGFARHIPRFPAPTLAGRIRGAICRPIFGKCGEDVLVEQGAFFGRGSGVEIGSHSAIGIRAEIMGVGACGGRLIIGDNVMMGPDVAILTVEHPLERWPYPPDTPNKAMKVVIEDEVFIGMRAIILPGVTIGRGAVVGAGAVVAKDVPPYAVVGGVPAKVMRIQKGADRKKTAGKGAA